MSVPEQEAWDKGYACGKLDAADRIEALEAALRLIDNMSTDYVAIKIARGTLASERTASEYEDIFKHLRKEP